MPGIGRTRRIDNHGQTYGPDVRANNGPTYDQRRNNLHVFHRCSVLRNRLLIHSLFVRHVSHFPQLTEFEKQSIKAGFFHHNNQFRPSFTKWQ